ncbi:MAG: hypothetical protein KJ892_14925, partial [Gammaproteobacteria bacterium]|nr:hypothetical protein [Gammaproteobacteria bacterium]
GNARNVVPSASCLRLRSGNGSWILPRAVGSSGVCAKTDPRAERSRSPEKGNGFFRCLCEDRPEG